MFTLFTLVVIAVLVFVIRAMHVRLETDSESYREELSVVQEETEKELGNFQAAWSRLTKRIGDWLS